MRKERILAFAAMFVGFMGIAMMARMGHLDTLGFADLIQLVGSGACLGAAITIVVKSINATAKAS